MAEEETAQIEKPTVSDVLQVSESLEVKDLQEGVIGNLALPDELKRFTDIGRADPQRFAKMFYEHQDIAAFEKWENEGGGSDYRPPDMPLELLFPDLNLRVSKLGKLIGVFKSISHLFEGGSGGGRVGLFGRRKG